MTQDFKVKPVDQRVLLTSTVVLNCISEGRPPPQISWSIFLKITNESFLLNESRKIIGERQMLYNGSLVIRNVSRQDEGFYTCLSSSPGLKRNHTAHISAYGMSTNNYKHIVAQKVRSRNHFYLNAFGVFSHAVNSKNALVKYISWLLRPDKYNFTRICNTFLQ